MGHDLSFERDGRRWPNREHSRFVRAAGIAWHVQVMGEGPVLLLAHGTGAATHSWRDLAPLLARRFRVVAPDLSGHGFTSAPRFGRLSLPGMSADLAALLKELDVAPDLVVGHSAGAAILIRMALDHRIAPRGIISLNGALLGFKGFAGQIFSPLAKLLAWNPFTPAVLAATMSGRHSVERLLRETGSTIDEAGQDLYRRLVASPGHVGAALGMMANWDLDDFERDLPGLTVPLLLLAGAHDRAVPPSVSHKVKAMVAGARVEEQRGLGHLSHEEKPEEIAALIEAFWTQQLGEEGGEPDG